jgi:hypothetical protein
MMPLTWAGLFKWQRSGLRFAIEVGPVAFPGLVVLLIPARQLVACLVLPWYLSRPAGPVAVKPGPGFHERPERAGVVVGLLRAEGLLKGFPGLPCP